MILVDADKISMSRPGRPLFTDVSLTISAGDRIGVVGLNGSGKSTLIDALIGVREPETGTVRRARNLRLSALAQQPDLGTGTIAAAVADGAHEEWEIAAVLDRLGMGGRAADEVESLSGGEAKRVALARALVAPADLLVLDEPTNHLDIDAIAWLENRLAAFNGGLLLVTHDRHVLDRVVNRVIELDRGTAYVHDGGYDAYLEGRAKREEQAVRDERVRKNLARTELAWLRRGAPARTTKAKSRIRSATEIVTARPADPARASSLDLHFGTPRLGNDVIELRGVGFSFDGSPAPLFTGVDLTIDRRERLGIVGVNGVGKSTLLDILAGRLSPTEGTVSTGSTVTLELFDQVGAELDPNKRVWEEVVGDTGAKPDWHDKALMERFWFDSDAQYAPVELLSGGERRRLQLLVTLARMPNVLLLDEPTNDIDLDTLRTLEDFLEDFPGAVVVVSHDRAFLERTVDDVVIFDDSHGPASVSRLPGGYAAYEELRRSRTSGQKSVDDSSSGRTPEPMQREAVEGDPLPSRANGRSKSTIRHELKQVERRVAELERTQSELMTRLSEAAGDHAALAGVGRTLSDVELELRTNEDRWLQLSEELEG